VCFAGFNFVLIQPIFDIVSALDKFLWALYWITSSIQWWIWGETNEAVASGPRYWGRPIV